MSIELFSELKVDISEADVLSIIDGIKDTYGYKLAYYDGCGKYGFLEKVSTYNDKEPPLFTVSFLHREIVLSTYGNLNQQDVIKKQVADVFLDKGIDLLLMEE